MQDLENQTIQTAEGSDTSRPAEQPGAAEESRVSAEFTDGEQKKTAPAEQIQSPERNAEYARRRRAAEEGRQKKHQEELESTRQSTRYDTILEILNQTNPYTGKPMTDKRDVEEYLAMKEIEAGGGDPVMDYANFHTERQRKQDRELADREAKKQWYEKDKVDFQEAHPEVDLGRLAEDEEFLDYADGKLGRRPLKNIYEGYLGMIAKRDKQARAIAARTVANKNASPGALSTPGTEQTYFSPEDVKKMSPGEVHKNYDKIRESMNRWNH